MRDDRIYIHHILDCVRRIDRYCQKGEEDFRGSELIQDAVLRNLQTLAESTQRISDHLKSLHPEVDWRAIAGFRNVLVHDYSRTCLGDCLGPSPGAPLQTEAIRQEADSPE